MTTPSNQVAPPVIFVHGVSLDPRLFASTAQHLHQPSDTWTRPGYDDTPSASSFDEQVERLLDHMSSVGPCIVAGVSGGATLGLAAATTRPSEMLGLVTHEPLIGPLAPTLHHRISNAAESLADDGSPGAVDAFLDRLYGATWTTRPAESVSWSEQQRGTVPTDVAQFAAFAPTRVELESITAAHTTTVGSSSAPERHDVAATLQGAGAEVDVIRQSGHLVLVDNPVRFASAITELAASIENRSVTP